MELDTQYALSGYALVHENLTFFKKIDTVLRADYEQLKPEVVRIISDQPWPTNVGFVGEGVTTASSENVLKAICMTTPPGGNVLVVTDNPLHGLAVEIAKTRYGYNCQSLQHMAAHPVESVIVQKIAGAMAANGFTLREIRKFCSKVRRVSVPVDDNFIKGNAVKKLNKSKKLSFNCKSIRDSANQDKKTKF